MEETVLIKEDIKQEMILKEYQNFIREKLSTVFREVKTEWNAMKEERALNVYSPRIDVSVGPFAVHGRLEEEYNSMIRNTQISQFIQKLFDYSDENLQRHEDRFIDARRFEDIVNSPPMFPANHIFYYFQSRNNS
ncbi:hypothetical protein JOC86_004509 [Bacillus pakistanensis]|uniref:Uncharacterized protein n=1 Tax=Rossellomorea pakistanensis TaxID=992288 RepID=A0ABS2NJ99_9BACI|nr:hypothetical protein [Bacillus pakistanensis]MBM7587934.1 hypothetical protein [Bacillus pakistanensis]